MTTTDTNQASEDELLRCTMYGVLHPEAQESFDNLVNGLACHYERLGKSIAIAHAADKYTLEYVYDQLRSLIRTEKLKLLAEVRERSQEVYTPVFRVDAVLISEINKLEAEL